MKTEIRKPDPASEASTNQESVFQKYGGLGRAGGDSSKEPEQALLSMDKLEKDSLTNEGAMCGGDCDHGS